MNLKLRHIAIIMTTLLFVACAMDTGKTKSVEASDILVVEEELSAPEVSELETVPNISTELIHQKLQDFYDLVALQNEHPEFNDEVGKQLKHYIKDDISNYTKEDFAVIKNIRQIGQTKFVNDSIRKIKLSYNKVSGTAKSTDTIYAIITNKKVNLDNEVLISSKIQFSKE